MVKVKSKLNTYVISKGQLITDNQTIKWLFNEVVEWPIDPDQGDTDFILANRMISVGGFGEVEASYSEQSDLTIIY